MFALLKVDKVMASTLPLGKYPVISLSKVKVIILLSWILSFSVSAIVNTLYPYSYEPAVVLCIPLLPIGFFISVFSVFCVIFTCIVFGFFISIIYLKKVNTFFLKINHLGPFFRSKHKSKTLTYQYRIRTTGQWRKLCAQTSC